MNKNYKESTSVIVYDTEKEMYERPFQDNIEEVLENENYIEMLKNAINAKKEELSNLGKDNKLLNVIMKISPVVFIIYFLISALLSIVGINGVINILFNKQLVNPIITLIAGILGMTSSAAMLVYLKKDQKITQNLKSQIAYLEREFKLALEKQHILEQDKTITKTPSNEVKSLDSYNEKRKKLLEEELDFLIKYQENRKFYQDQYYEGTLSNSNELRLVRKFMEKEY